jgi:phosphoribosylformimino-5-aminoimidazole carboxamide ribotide isomerase
MEVVPVLDVARGEVVRGVQGERANYRPIVTPLAVGSDPVVIAGALMRLHPFRKLYVADLDGIEGRGRNVHLVPALSAALKATEIWIDAGTASRKAARAVLAAPVTTLVVGSESVETAADLTEIIVEAPQRTVLSLDFRRDEFMGPSSVLDNAALWPDRIIVMTLTRVGSDEGPDLARIGQIIARAGKRKVYAAGGVRNRADLDAVKRAGAAGVLAASALHTGKITSGDLKELARR